jgi:hypothetical protein
MSGQLCRSSISKHLKEYFPVLKDKNFQVVRSTLYYENAFVFVLAAKEMKSRKE